MLGQWRKALALASMLGGLCLPVQANTTMSTGAEGAGAAAAPATAPGAAPVAPTAAPSAAAVPSAVDLSSTERVVRIALLLPLQSETLRQAAEAVRDGFQAAYEREKEGISISVVETGDSAEDTLTGYKNAGMQNDIVVGPLSRTGVTAVVQGGLVDRPTIALTPPDTAGVDAAASPQRLPPLMLVMGLSIEEEARQAADWAGQERPSGKAIVLFTKSAWQRRAARAFELQWQQLGREVEPIELIANDGFLNGRGLMQLKKQILSQPDKQVVLFLALDARQARQVRAIVGSERVTYYGTSQLNPHALSDRFTAERFADMDGIRLLDIPWQLQADHPAVMVYPRPVVNADQTRNADMERLYALGIDAYRIAREIANDRTDFGLDGVTGKLTVRFDKKNPHFERTTQRAVYRDGAVAPAIDAQ